MRLSHTTIDEFLFDDMLQKENSDERFARPYMQGLADFRKLLHSTFDPKIAREVNGYAIPVSKTAITFLSLARSKSSIWYSRGSCRTEAKSCFAINLDIDSSLSSATLIAFLTSASVIASALFDSLYLIF